MMLSFIIVKMEYLVYKNFNRKEPYGSNELIPKKQSHQRENNEVSTLASIFAGIGSGLIDIPGLFSLGASIYDLTNDTNKAAK